MANKVEKLVSQTGSGFRKTRASIKRATSKARRRDGKIRGEDASPRVTKGWVD